MSIFDSSELLDLRRRGFWVGPGESEEEFSARVKRCPSTQVERGIPDEEWEKGSLLTEARFGFRPDWIETRVGRSELLFAGGADMAEVPRVELGSRVWRRGRPVPRDELVAHEWFHAARMAFEEPRFEEIIAFQTSRSWWRRLFSPVVQSTREVIAVALVCFAAPFVTLMKDPHPLLPLTLLFSLLTLRLSWRQWLWARTSRRLPPPLSAQLTDREIRKFAFKSKEEIWHYLEERSSGSLRYRQLLAVGSTLCGVADSKESAVLCDGSTRARDPSGGELL